jgi:hypothetical protein
VASREGLIGVACPATNLCVAISNGGKVLVSADPAAGANAWKTISGLTVAQSTETLAQQRRSGQYVQYASDLTCPSTRLCVIGQPGLSSAPGSSPYDPIGSLVYSTDPLGGASAWHTVQGIDGNRGAIQTLSCPSVHLCYAFSVGADKYGNDLDTPLVSTNPTGGSSAWRVSGPVMQDAGVVSLACKSTRLCVAAGAVLLWTTHPTGSQSQWASVTNASGSGPFVAVSCPSIGLCIAAPENAGCKPCGAGNDLVSTDPLAGTWHATTAATWNISCHGITLCIGPGNGEKPFPELAYSTDPAGKAWDYVSGLGKGLIIRAVSCASTRLCVGVGDDGLVVVGQR